MNDEVEGVGGMEGGLETEGVGLDQMDHAWRGRARVGKIVGVEVGEIGVMGRRGQPEEKVIARGRGNLMGVGVEEEGVNEEERGGEVVTLLEVGVDKAGAETEVAEEGKEEPIIKGGGGLLVVEAVAVVVDGERSKMEAIGWLE